MNRLSVVSLLVSVFLMIGSCGQDDEVTPPTAPADPTAGAPVKEEDASEDKDGSEGTDSSEENTATEGGDTEENGTEEEMPTEEEPTEEPTEKEPSDEEITSDDPLAVYQKIYGATDIYREGNFVIIKTKGRPDHKSPYYVDTQWEAELHEEYNGDNSRFRLNPNRIGEFNYTFKIPLNPEEATNHQATPMGAIGVSLNGVPFYNQYAAPDEPLTNEFDSFDQYNGHPTGNSNYHYHVEPLYLTEQQGKDVLLGFLLDGFPVYGPTENGKLVKNTDLDDYHGHTHATDDYPNGTYHYHITTEDPYINGNGFYGTAGTFAQ